jgi:GNAT superfamily N-acetyltransferase
LKQVKTGTISLATTPQAIARCHAVMRELRPHYDEETRFVADVTELMGKGYHLAYVEYEGVVRSVTCYRISKNLSWGKHLFVEDLVTREADRSSGFGGQLFDWLVAEARRHACGCLHLDSGVHRYGAHRFYLLKRMDIIAHHFSLGLD